MRRTVGCCRHVADPDGVLPMTTVCTWTGNHGRVVLTLHSDGRLVKSEKSCDRLHVLGDRGHAIDCSMIAEALSLGAKTLEIREDGGAYVWCAELAPLLAKSKVVTLAGVRRWELYLEHFTLTKGEAPGWYIDAQSRKKIAERREAGAGNVQMSLFDDAAGCRLRYEL